MMRLIFLLFVVLPTHLVAAPAEIRSGEHETFSRLVITMPEGAEWNVIDTETGFLLTIPPLEEGFQTTGVFERIPRSRLTNVLSQSTNQLVLDVECDCYLDIFLWQPGKLVVDIVDGVSPDDTTLAAPTDLEFEEEDPSAQSLPDLLSLSAEQPSSVELDFGQEQVQLGSMDPDLEITEAALIEALARAASQGFLDAPVQNAEVLDEEMSSPEPLDNPVEPPSAPIQGPSPHPGVGITNAMDRDLALIGRALEQSFERQCLPAEYFAMADWADERALHIQIAELAEALVGEFGEEPLAAQDALARIYIYFGFGAEALSVLAHDNAVSQERQVLAELAGIVDNEKGPFDLLSSQEGCETLGGLWAFLLSPRELEDQPRNQILRNYFRLPQPLRGQIAPRFSESFLEIGDVDAANNVLRATIDQDTETSHETQVARAEVALETNNPELALNVLTEEAEDNARTTPESVIRLINLALEQGALPSDADLVLASALRQEYRSEPIAAELAIAQARGHAALGEYSKAMELMLDRKDVEALSVNNEIFFRLSMEPDTTRFLEFAYGEIPTGLTPLTENAMARRLLDLGFAERTDVFLTGPSQGEAAFERRYLRAEAAIAMNDFSGAIEALEGLTDERGRVLSAQAFSGMGDYEAALAVAPSSDAVQDQAALQFRAEAWESLSAQDDPVLSSFANTVLEDFPESTTNTLEERRAILGEAAQSRENVEALLRRFDGLVPSN